MADIVGYDAVTIGNIPLRAAWAAGYTSGRFPTYLPLRARMPVATPVLAINITDTLNGHVLDCEQGDVPPAAFDRIATWAKRQILRGVKPRIYASLSVMQPIVAGLEARGLKRSQFFIWTAHYTFRQHRCSPACGFGFKSVADCTQFSDKALGLSLDASSAIPAFLEDPGKPKPKPVPKPKPAHQRGKGVLQFHGTVNLETFEWTVDGDPSASPITWEKGGVRSAQVALSVPLSGKNAGSWSHKPLPFK
jgi:hypothetical protein